MIEPLGKRILLEPEAVKEETTSGIILVDTGREKQPRGTVIALGEMVESKKLKVGAKVIHANWGPQEYKEGDKTYLLISEDDVLAVESGKN